MPGSFEQIGDALAQTLCWLSSRFFPGHWGEGGRCEMGDLTKYSATTGQCLPRVRVVKSDLLRFDIAESSSVDSAPAQRALHGRA
jgi:hypothetical protein